MSYCWFAQYPSIVPTQAGVKVDQTHTGGVHQFNPCLNWGRTSTEHIKERALRAVLEHNPTLGDFCYASHEGSDAPQYVIVPQIKWVSFYLSLEWGLVHCEDPFDGKGITPVRAATDASKRPFANMLS